VSYTDRGGLDRFASDWRSERRGQWFTVPKLSGPCLLLKRSVLEAIGGLDERSGIGSFADEDLAHRVKQSGFTLAVAHDLFVHHYGPSGSRLPSGAVRLAE
jgi:O-antigen biosynthesis protein